MLNILEHFDLKPLGAGSAASLHLMAETMKLGYADRYRVLGDTGFVRAPVAGWYQVSSGSAPAVRARRRSRPLTVSLIGRW